MPHDFTGLPLDAKGWTDYETIVAGEGYENARVVFVSDSDGNDGTASIYGRSKLEFDADGMFQPDGSVNAYKTVGAAMAQMRNGFPDILLLKRGDTFTGGSFVSGSWGTPVSGANLLARSIISSYGTHANRPEVLTGLAGAVNASGKRYTILSGIRFFADDWEDYDYDDPTTTKVGRSYNAQTNSTHQLVEDCEFERYYGARIEASSAQYVCVRRNLWKYSNAHDGFIFIGGRSKWICIEENLFYVPTSHRWLEGRGRCLYTSPGGSTEGKDHHECVWVRNNIFFKSAERASVSYRTSGPFTGNLVLECDSMGFGGGGGSSGTWQHGQIVNNVIADSVRAGTLSAILLHSQQTPDDGHWPIAEVTSNLLLPTKDAGGSTSGILLSTSGGDPWAGDAVRIQNNVIFDFRNNDGAGRPINASGGMVLTDVEIKSNQLQQPNGGQLIDLSSTTAEGAAFEGNHYYTTDSDNYLNPGGTYTNWLTETEETDSAFSEITYTDPTRRPSTYLGSESDNEELMDACLLQSRQNWDEELTANEINDWLREGFDLTAAELPDPPPDPAAEEQIESPVGKAVVRQQKFVVAGTGSRTVELNATPLVGSILLAVHGTRNAPGTITGPTGFTHLGTGGTSGSSRSQIDVWVRKIDGTEDSPREVTVSNTTTTQSHILQVLEISGVDGVDISAFATSDNTRVKTLTCGPTASVSSSKNVAFAFFSGGAGNEAWPSNEAALTDGFDIDIVNWTNGQQVFLVQSRKELSASGGVQTTINLAASTGNADGARMSGAIVVFEASELEAGTIVGERFEDSASLTSETPTGGEPPYSYQWHRSTTADFEPGESTEIEDATSLTLDDEGLDPEVIYYYKLVVTDDDETVAVSNEVAMEWVPENGGDPIEEGDVPAAFENAQWSVSPLNEALRVRILELPDADPEITDIEYRLHTPIAGRFSVEGTASPSPASADIGEDDNDQWEWEADFALWILFHNGTRWVISAEGSEPPVFHGPTSIDSPSGNYVAAGGGATGSVVIHPMLEPQSEQSSGLSGTGQFEIESLTNGVRYGVQLRAVNAEGEADWSSLKTGTPNEPPQQGGGGLVRPITKPITKPIFRSVAK